MEEDEGVKKFFLFKMSLTLPRTRNRGWNSIHSVSWVLPFEARPPMPSGAGAAGADGDDDDEGVDGDLGDDEGIGNETPAAPNIPSSSRDWKKAKLIRAGYSI